MGFFKEKINTGPEKIKEVLTKGVSEVAVRENLEKRLRAEHSHRPGRGFMETKRISGFGAPDNFHCGRLHRPNRRSFGQVCQKAVSFGRRSG